MSRNFMNILRDVNYKDIGYKIVTGQNVKISVSDAPRYSLLIVSAMIMSFAFS